LGTKIRRGNCSAATSTAHAAGQGVDGVEPGGLPGREETEDNARP